MNLIKVVESVGRSKMHSAGNGDYKSIIAGNPLPTLIKPLKEYADQLRINITAYDAATMSLNSVESVQDYISEQYTDMNFSEKDFVKCTEDEAQILLSGMQQAKEILNPNAPYIGITSTSGLLYNICPDIQHNRLLSINESGTASLLLYYDHNENSWMVRPEWPSSIHPGEYTVPFSIDNIITNIEKVIVLDGYTVSAYTISDLASLILHYHQAEGTEDYTIIQAYREIASYYTSDDVSQYTIAECLSACLQGREPVSSGVSDSDAKESMAVIISGLAVSATMNQVMIETIDSLGSSSFTKWLNNATTWVRDQHKSVQRFLKRISTAYAQGGFKGVIYTIYDILRGQSSITSDEGILKFTESDKLLPAEYIVGMVSQIFGAVSTAISIIISVVVPVIGAIGSLLGSIAWGIIGSAKKDKSDTRASVPESDLSDEQAFNMIPYGPMALLRGEFEVDSTNPKKFAWYVQFYDQTGSCAYVDVPGGTLFVGPGGFDTQNGVKRLSKIRWEFHPYGMVLNRTVLQTVFGTDFEYKVQTGVAPLKYFISMLDARTLWNGWNRILHSDNFQDLSVVNAANTGVLTEDHDALLRYSVIFSTTIFLQWLWDTLYGLIPNDTDIRWMNFQSHNVDKYDGEKITLSFMDFFFETEHLSQPADWATIIRYYADSSVDFDNDGTFTFGNYGFEDEHGDITSDNLRPLYVPINGEDIYDSLPALMNELTGYTTGYFLNIGNAVALPFSPIYSINPPKYNASTFWMWIALSALTVAAVTTALAIGAVKFNNWRKQQRFKSIESTNSAREKMDNALKGKRQGPDGEETFDPSSAEGKAYINSTFKSYKKAVFKANLKQHLVGGTRFDTTSFYGDASADEGSSLADTISSNKLLSVSGDGDAITDDLDYSTTQVDLSSVIHLIKTPA